MIEAAEDAIGDYAAITGKPLGPHEIYRAMIAAAPVQAVDREEGSSRSQPSGRASADAEVSAGLNAAPSAAWRPIAEYEGCFPVIAARPAYTAGQFGPATAFRDVTGVWRAWLSEGGNDQLPFKPTHWMTLPQPPASETPRKSEGGEA
jgi:hypothetical protein